MSVRFGLATLRFGREGLALLAVAMIAGCVGGSGGSGAGSPPINTSPTPIISYPGSFTGTATAGSAASTAVLGPIGAGYAAEVGFPAITPPSVAVGLGFTTTLPSGAPALSALKRAPLAIGVPLTAIDYVSMTPTATLSLSRSPGFQFTLPSGMSLASGAQTYVAYFDPTSSAGWVNLDGPGVQSPAGTYTFTYNPVPMTLQAGTTYLFAFYTATANLPPYSGASPSPSPSASSSIPPGLGTPLAGPTSGPGGTTWGPTAVANVLQFPVQSGYNGMGKTIAVVTDSIVTNGDLNAYLSYFQIPATSRTFVTASINGASTSGPPTDSNAALTLETVAGLAPGANIIDVVVNPGYSPTDLAAAYAYIVGPPAIANVAVLPAPSCITGSPPNAAILSTGAGENIAFVAPVGDNGSTCAATATAYTYYPYPASDVSVTAVGGTQTSTGTTLGSLLSQDAWNDAIGATGGGYTTSIPLPSYQASVVPSGQAGRNVPDVAMPAVLAPVYYNGAWSATSTTQWSAALYGALLADVDQYCNGTVTDPVAVPYTVDANRASAFLDVVGSNNAFNGSRPFFSAGIGYDNVSGIGVPLGLPFAQTICPNHTPLSIRR